MEFEVSFEIIDKTFCESSFTIHKSTKRRSCPSVKRLDAHLSKIKTSLKHKISIKKLRLAINIEPRHLNISFSNLSEQELTKQQQDLHTKTSLFVKNKNINKKKSTATVIKRIERTNNIFVDQVKPDDQIESDMKRTIQVLNKELSKASNKRPRMGVSSIKNANQIEQIEKLVVPSISHLPFLEENNKSIKTSIIRPIFTKKIRSL